jgi:hypothetical protein
MFGRRDFEESSSSSFEAEDPGTPPPDYQQGAYRSSFDHEFELEAKPKTQFTTGPPSISRQEAVPQSFQPVKKESNEKVGIFNHYEDPEPPQERPVTANRPGSSSAQMRQKMMEAQKKKLMERPGPPTLVSTGGLLGSMKMESAPLGDALYSGPLLSEKDLSGNKGLKNFGNSGFTFEPNPNKTTFESLPGPIKADVRVIGREEVEEVKLDERTATKNEPSNILKEMQKKMEEAKYQPRAEPQVPQVSRVPQEPQIEAHAKVIEVQPKPEIRAQEIPKPEVLQVEETKTDDQSQKPKEEVKNSTETRRPEAKEEVKAPVPRPPPVNIREILSNEMRDMKKFISSPLRKGILLQCSIRRDKSGFNRLFPKYYMQTSEGLNFLLAGKKRAGSRTSNYMVTMDQKDFNTKSPSFVGKVRSNFLGTEFMAFDAGLNPKRKGANPTNVRSELGVVLYVFFN